MKCRFCRTPLSLTFADLGNSPPSNSYLSKEQLDAPEIFLPLKALVCENCFLVQLNEVRNPADIFNETYSYFSSYSSSWLDHCKKYTHMMVERFGLSKHSKVIEIASNDGYLLQFFKELNIPVLGIEPSSTAALAAKEKGIQTEIDFFSADLSRKIVDKHGNADLVIGNNVLAHVPELMDFVSGLKTLLNVGGVITLEFPHLLQLVLNRQFDTIYHEHYSYFSFTTFAKIMDSHELTVFDVEEISTHGGSLRVFMCHSNDFDKKISKNVSALLKKESIYSISSVAFYNDFQRQIISVKNDFLEFLIYQQKKGKKISAYGAAAKGNTLLNFCGIKRDTIEFVVDINPLKQNKYLPGSHIPILDEVALQNYRPDYVVIFPWNLKEEIAHQLKYSRSWGCKFITAIPQLEIF